MSTVSIRCPNCGGNSSHTISENKYQCIYCDDTFDYANPDIQKISENMAGQQVMVYNCSICGRTMQSRFGNRCMTCKKNDFCSNCIFETAEKKIACKTCYFEMCPQCDNHAEFRCAVCIKLHEKDLSHVIARTCSKHVVLTLVAASKHRKVKTPICIHCGGYVCGDCTIADRWNSKCRNCGNKIKHIKIPIDNRLSTAINFQNFLDAINQAC